MNTFESYSIGPGEPQRGMIKFVESESAGFRSYQALQGLMSYNVSFVIIVTRKTKDSSLMLLQKVIQEMNKSSGDNILCLLGSAELNYSHISGTG